MTPTSSGHRPALRDVCCCMLMVTLLGGCAAKVPYPGDWPAVAPVDGWCRGISGAFENRPSRTTEEDPDEVELELDELFFGKLLDGFELTHLTFEPLETGAIRVSPWVGSTRLEEAALIEPHRNACRDDRWRVDTGWDMDGYMIATGLVWTGGLLVPAAFKGTFTLSQTRDGRLAVHATAYSAGAFALVFPYRARIDDSWFLYDRMDVTAAQDAE